MKTACTVKLHMIRKGTHGFTVSKINCPQDQIGTALMWNKRGEVMNNIIEKFEEYCNLLDEGCPVILLNALELLKSKPDIDKIVKELDDTSKQYEPRPFESINWMLRYEGIRIGLEIAQYVVKGEPIPDEF